MPLKQGTETSRDKLFRHYFPHKKDAPKAGDGNWLESAACWREEMPYKKDAPKAGDGTSLPY